MYPAVLIRFIKCDKTYFFIILETGRWDESKNIDGDLFCVGVEKDSILCTHVGSNGMKNLYNCTLINFQSNEYRWEIF